MTGAKRTTGLFCPGCGNDTVTAVTDSRPTLRGDITMVRRRRACRECGYRYTTLEMHEAQYKVSSVELAALDKVQAMLDDFSLQLENRRETLIKQQQYDG